MNGSEDDKVAVYFDEPRVRATTTTARAGAGASGADLEIGITVPATKRAVADGSKLTRVPEISFASPPASRVWPWRTMKGVGLGAAASAASWLLLAAAVLIIKFVLKGMVYVEEPRERVIIGGAALGGRLLLFGIGLVCFPTMIAVPALANEIRVPEIV